MKEFDIEERVKIAVQNFESGYNCAQSVFLAYSDVFELNLDMAKKMSDLFKEKHGTIICRSLLPAAEASQTAPEPSARTAEYYAKRPCSKYVEDAARIAGRMLKNELD